MFLPYEMTVNLWFSASPLYRWEPLPPAPEPDPEPPCADGQVALPEGSETEASATARPASLPAMRLVFKGLKWTAHPVYNIRENLGWNEASALLQSVDDQNRDDSQREARKQPAKPPLPKPRADWESP